ncbi:Xaa-Pro dipeptidase [Alteribacillus persepolensis]|uniref:Xaa-Pro dipeptidase n=1 Tax=Alteribacillus persepolensis TaxID=568899 RepID=A0A1G8GTD0_9BACI|nr:Xaa-Pro peptidase family protein [Alteribacillus persepolensis]SDH97654.1 Xaa-Pro dipeptidase [Alteribacillus persepolensis]
MGITDETLKRRLDGFRKRMRDKEIDMALLVEPDNQYYVSGFRAISYSRPIICLVYLNSLQFILPELEKDHASQSARTDELYVYHEIACHRGKDTQFHRPLEHLLDRQPASSTIGVEVDTLPAALYCMLHERNFIVKDMGPDLMEMRMKKDQEEIHWIKQAGVLSDLALESSLHHVQPGISELELDSFGDKKLLEAASQQFPDQLIGFADWTCSGITRSFMPHLASSTRKLEKNDVVVHSRQVWVNHYRAENERTFLIGRPSNEQKYCLELAIEAQAQAMQVVKPGVCAKDIDLAAYHVFEKHGYGEHVQHRTGHGLGLTEHEEPYLRFDNELQLEEGMVYTIEPGIYVPGVGGFRHSDTVIVTNNGFESVTQYPRSLEDMIL